jgi:hypothetical protein
MTTSITGNTRHRDVPAAEGGGRRAKVTPFDLSRDDRGERGCLVENVFSNRANARTGMYGPVKATGRERLRTSDSSLLTAAVHKQPLQQ